MRPFTLIPVAAAAGLAVAVGLFQASCSSTPPDQPIRTFERAQRMDVICVDLPNLGGRAKDAPVVGLPERDCAPSPIGVNTNTISKHLFALVTQTARGEIGIVDMTAQTVVDTDHGTPGVTFVPVGTVPVDITAAPDGKMSYVASGEPNRPAIYGLPTTRVLGDYAFNGQVPSLQTWPVCTLPERPSAVTTVAHGDSYEIVVVLGGSRLTPGRVVTLAKEPFFDSSIYPPGEPVPCRITSELAVRGDFAAEPPSGPTWPNGVPYVDGGIDLTGKLPPVVEGCTNTVPDAGAPADAGGTTDAGTADAASDAGASDASSDASVADAGERVQGAARLTNIVRDGHWLYISDDTLPIIHVLDMSQQGAPKEVAPLEVSSLLDPAKKPTVTGLAVSPVTRDFRRFLYAIERREGTIAVFDVTDPEKGPRGPLARPNPELTPFQPPDRLAFAVPVVAVGFARHDLPLRNAGTPAAAAGALCDPNPANANTVGAAYRNDRSADIALGPDRLRGVFAFVTLSNGSVITVDVDDWDAPCRRPANLVASNAGAAVVDGKDAFLVSSLAASDVSAPQTTGIGAYDVPNADTAVSGEAFFPVSAPHRIRSKYRIRNDADGNRIPRVSGSPLLFAPDGTPQATLGDEGAKNATILPTYELLADPPNAVAFAESPSAKQGPGIRMSFESPDVHADQDWNVAYEGALPGFNGVFTAVSTTDNYATLTLSNPEAHFCRKGIEDAELGNLRARAAAVDMTTDKLVDKDGRPLADFTGRLGDYVQLSDAILDVSDPYWREPNACWAGINDPRAPNLENNASSTLRHDYCAQVFGERENPPLSRDFPIVEAYDDRLVLGTYDAARRITKGNTAALRAMQCCFHNQVRFGVRAGGEWMTIGSGAGYLHHVVADATTLRCGQSCSARESLLNARSLPLPRPQNQTFLPALVPSAKPPRPPYLDPEGNQVFVPSTRIPRNSSLAFRNPIFSFVTWNGAGAPTRDLTWKFTTIGQLSSQAVNLAASSTRVSPQSMRYIDGFGQMAVVDAADQGLVLIDLNNVTLVPRTYY